MRVSCWLAVVALLAAPPAAWAQDRTVRGRVTAAGSGAALAEALVSVEGTRVSVRTGAQGDFVVPRAPAGQVRLFVRAIGHKSQRVVIPPGVDSVAVALEPDVLRLEEVVVTGQATGVERQNLPNAVATVSADELTRAPTPTLENALQGKIPGAVIAANSGAPGGGMQVNLRGTSTITGSVDPLYVIDGIVVSNAAIPSNMDAVTGSRAGGNPRVQDDPVNRIADLNPEDIERIEVLKGASAAAIYGAKAANGVIIITTKRGRSGRTQFNVSQRFGTFVQARSLGSRTFASAEEAAQVFPEEVVAAHFQPGRVFDFEGILYGRNALSTETSANLSGGTELTKYFVSGLVKNDEGIALNTGYQKQALRLNLDQVLSDRFTLSVGTNIIHSLAKRGVSNNDNTGTSPYLVFPFTPNFVDLQATEDGVFPENPTERSNPLQTFALLRNDEDVWRALGTATLRFTALETGRQSLVLSVIGGADYFDQRNDFLAPPELEFEPNDGQPGTVVLGKARNLNLNLSLNAAHTLRSADGGFEATTSAGVQYEDRELDLTSIIGRNLLTGQQSPDQAASRDPAQEIQKVRDLGIFAQEEVLLMDRRLLLTVGARADRSSNNGNTDKYFVYPKAAVSYRLVDVFGPGGELKLRGAWGQTGNLPPFGAKFNTDTSGTIGGRFGVLIAQRAGDPNIKPERQSEFEAGFDATLSGGRALLSVSVYQRNIRDLLLEATLPSSTGQQTRLFSTGGRMRNRGVELGLTLAPVQSPTFNWVFRSTFFANRATITELPIPTYQTGGFSQSLGTFQIEEGKSPTQIFGSEGLVGDANPDFLMSFANDFELGRLSFGALLDWKKGGDIINLTQFLYDAGANSADWETHGRARFAFFNAGNTKAYVQDGSFLKLRELSLSYTLPEALTAGMFGGSARYARLTLAGRNLFTISPYDGLDPEVSNFGNQAIVRNIDVAPFPPSRSFFLSVDLGF
jgi:TonB-linked SusC/RagA family outer membrane protein